MKKFFTFVICALCAVSLQATVVEIGTGGTMGTSSYAPIYVDGTTYVSLTQMLYLSSEITPSGITQGTITAISFYSKDFLGTSAIPKTRDIEVWIDFVSSSSFSGDYFYGKSSSNPIAGTKVFSGTITLPIAEGWYTISLDSPIEWDSSISSKKNIIITINDVSKTRTATGAKKHKTYTATSNRTRYKKGENDGTCFDASNAWSIEGTVMKDIPVIKFTFEGGDEPEPDPTITVSGAELDFGSYYPAAETVSQTFKVTASDLTNDIALSTAAAGVSISPTSIEKDNADLAGDGVEVTVTLGSEYTFPITNPTISVASEGASKSLTLKATKITDSDFTPQALNFISTNGYYIVNNDVTIQSINTSDKLMEIKAATATKDADYTLIDGQETFAVGGKFSGLKGKYENEVFKIFSYNNYTAPTPTSVVEVDEDVDHSTDWADIEDGENVSALTIKRTIVPNEWNSIVLPTHLTSTEVGTIFGAGTDVEKFTNAVITSSNITLNFTKETNGLEAGVPYLIKPKQALPNPLNLTNHSFTKTVTPFVKDGIEFVGVLVPTDIDGNGDDYIIVGSGNTLLHPSGAGTIKGMRAYFHVVGEAAKAAIRKSPMISLSTGSTTAMTLVKPDAGKAYKAIENGRIVIKANGKKVNVLGQTVK